MVKQGGLKLAKIEEKIETLVKEKIENLGYELYDVLYLKEGPSTILRIVIDSKERYFIRWLWKSK